MHALEKLQEDLIHSKHTLSKMGLYKGKLKNDIEHLLSDVKDDLREIITMESGSI